MRLATLGRLVRSLSPESQSAYLQPPLSTIELCLAQIEADPSEPPTTDGLCEDVEWLFSRVGSAQAIIARRLAEIDRREHHGPPDPYQSRAQWLHHTFDAAYAQVRSQDRWQGGTPPCHPPTSNGVDACGLLSRPDGS